MANLSAADKHHLEQISGKAATRPISPDPASLRERRKALGLTGRKFAQLAGISTCALSCLERGREKHYGKPAVRRVEDTLARMERARHPDGTKLTGADLSWREWLAAALPCFRRNLAAIAGEARP
jgi:DNA-binding XRE family transcriptional regulator